MTQNKISISRRYRMEYGKYVTHLKTWLVAGTHSRLSSEKFSLRESIENISYYLQRK